MRVFWLLIILLCCSMSYAQANDGIKMKKSKSKSVYMLTYFRQRYANRVEINSIGNIVDDALFPAEARHGTVSVISAKEAKRLIAAFGY